MEKYNSKDNINTFKIEINKYSERIIIGSEIFTLWCGPCAVESRQQIFQTAAFLSSFGIKFLRGGVFKPRSSLNSFQGLGKEAILLLAEAAETYGMLSVTEVLDPRDVSLVADYIDIIQVGTRNMQNFALLKELAYIKKPVLLKRGMSSTLREFLLAAEYITVGNPQVILCERGIRTFETSTRSTLDLSTAILAKQESKLPVIIDISHSLGRTDIMVPMGRAVISSGVDGLMCEVHPNPSYALSDGEQSMNFEQFRSFYLNIRPFINFIEEYGGK